MAMRIIDKDKEAKLERIIREAGDKLLSMWPGGNGSRKSELQRFTKEDGSIVTTADLEVNDLIVRSLEELFPDTEIMSEELSDTHDGGRGDKLWILDPLDGTKHFAEGKKNFCILLGLAERGRMIYGAMYLPVTDEFLTAQKGQGTLLNGEYVRVSDIDKPRPQSIFTEHFNPAPSAFLVQEKIDSCEAFLRLCSGKLDGAIIRLTSHKSWDLAPFSILVEESGGSLTDEKGAAPLYESKKPGINYVIATNGKVHAAVASLLCDEINRER